jgi:hypothetical protein
MKRAVLAEKLWDTFRSLNYFRGPCRKTYDQLGAPVQNLWLAIATTALRYGRGANSTSKTGFSNRAITPKRGRKATS